MSNRDNISPTPDYFNSDGCGVFFATVLLIICFIILMLILI